MLDEIFGQNWFSIRLADDAGFIAIRGSIYASYSHENPGRIHMQLTEVVVGNAAGGAELNFTASLGDTPRDPLASS